MLKNFQSLRFFFSMTVFMAHFEYAGINGYSTGIGVIFFFLLSGFLMGRNHGHKICDGTFKFRTFFLRRLIKLYPIHLMCLVLFMISNIHFVSIKDWKIIASNALLLQSWIPSTDYYFSCNSVSWSTSDMIFFIMAFPFLYKVIGKLNKHGILIFTTILISVYILYMLKINCEDLNYWLYIFPPAQLVCFTLGLILWRSCTLWQELGKIEHHVSLTESLLLLAVIVSYATYPVDERWHVSFIHWLVLIPLILFFREEGTENRGGIISRVLHTRIMLWLGSMTLEIFMLHMLTINAIIRISIIIGIEIPYPVMLILCIAVTILLSYIVQTYYVRPITNKLLSFTSSK